ncbi:GNAT family N-acetyltransferase [Kribbella sp. NBC_01245]|uniref:GNAT family N-acetyltransferase n=1 Tax=Kribbella sp. NBC_01245 TaxID=2903578 RepID=UPI002E27CE4B|nr:GNAT family N-acetyltransferase [Kribbella sp. NBC_01245]
MSVQVLPATPERWADVVTVMGERGDPSRCWCQYFRLRGKDWERSPKAKRAALKAQVDADPPPGVLAYDDGTPCGWCAIAPRTSYARVLASKNWRHPSPPDDEDGVWTVTCFVVPVGHRRQGMASHLLRGAVELARKHGATTVEGNAVDLDKAGRVASADLYRGPLSVFRDEGFEEVRRISPNWVLVSREL